MSRAEMEEAALDAKIAKSDKMESEKRTRAEKRRLDRGMGICFHPQCQKLRKLNDMGLCRACDPATIRKGSDRDVRL